MARAPPATAVGRHREAPTTAPSRSGGHEVVGRSSLAAPLRAQVVSATLHQTGSLETIVSYSIELACGTRRWSVERRYSEFARLHSDLGHDAPNAEFDVVGGASLRPLSPPMMNHRSWGTHVLWPARTGLNEEA